MYAAAILQEESGLGFTVGYSLELVGEYDSDCRGNVAWNSCLVRPASSRAVSLELLGAFSAKLPGVVRPELPVVATLGSRGGYNPRKWYSMM